MSKHIGVDLISDALPFGRMWYGEPDAISNAVGYAKFAADHIIPSFAFTTKLATIGCESYPERDATGAVPVSGEGCTGPSYGTKQH
jgi:hypothetical protein